MPANVYECLILLDTTKVAGNLPPVVEVLQATLQKHNAEILASRPWDERKLAYPIRSQKKGLYYLVYFRSDGKNLVEMEADFKLNESILRYVVIRIEEKWVETMLALARDEHALALQAVSDEEGDGDSFGGGRRDRGDRGDRGDRSERRPAPAPVAAAAAGENKE
jgi:small subunit ribosomal protein S6